ncbi:hypothetical protein ACQKNB_04025 [Lysinibacillus xylanilyticus]|uniref:hypothetical protein n=1 Tax=Lysinibacillus xylanilyticus TaxID=582475 RepID=UPI003D0478E1
METGRLLGDHSVTDETLERSEAAHRTPPGSSALRESEASAANVLSVRKRSDSNKAPSRNGNQPLVLHKSHTLCINLFFCSSN